MNNPIGIFDSGIGGLTILKKIKDTLPNENIIYYNDSKNNPYGEKSDEELLIISKKIINYLLNNSCKLIVIACNTATTRCIKKLREEYPQTIIIGTEPAIKPACDNDHHNILVLGTEATISSNKLKKLINDNKKDNQNIYLQSCPNLAHAIELNNQEEINELLKIYLEKYTNIDAVVLGCTHYPYVASIIKSYFPESVLYDSSIGVANEVKRRLIILNLLNESQKEGTITIKKEQ